jgi:hypothetical protein
LFFFFFFFFFSLCVKHCMETHTHLLDLMTQARCARAARAPVPPGIAAGRAAVPGRWARRARPVADGGRLCRRRGDRGPRVGHDRIAGRRGADRRAWQQVAPRRRSQTPARARPRWGLAGPRRDLLPGPPALLAGGLGGPHCRAARSGLPLRRVPARRRADSGAGTSAPRAVAVCCSGQRACTRCGPESLGPHSRSPVRVIFFFFLHFLIKNTHFLFFLSSTNPMQADSEKRGS